MENLSRVSVWWDCKCGLSSVAQEGVHLRLTCLASRFHGPDSGAYNRPRPALYTTPPTLFDPALLTKCWGKTAQTMDIIEYWWYPGPRSCCFDVIKSCIRVCQSEKKKQKNYFPPKLIFCHKLWPLDWIMVIWAIFGLPGPSEGSGGPMWVLGGPAETKFTNFHMGQFLALRCCFLDLTSF